MATLELLGDIGDPDNIGLLMDLLASPHTADEAHDDASHWAPRFLIG